ncbi:uncharacterized protein LOC127260603 [Andrographis paniculata]|uniref:uncharacterized protein LOC127260603 n=1 Tax=Andrographis paniculata TaxID=175694 RepID=UPI0021E950BF|nr:uncharacterized protein LOC127260603 [Andrographis paniculata]XP_051144381.1 uncharacterized protein LOC127260603 [Andrographis paniculata]XP_051144382.1 uncharacterized protein LOC127260603 [Andrographis paniculata]
MNKPLSSCPLSSPKLSIFFLTLFVILLIFLQIRSLNTPPIPSFPLARQWEKIVTNSCLPTLNDTADKLRESITFLPLKDLRYANVAMKGHTWFMSSMYDSHEEGEVQYQQFPSKASNGRVLCLKGRDERDGSWNSYALAWPDALPENATLMKGITFVSYNHYDYYNIWHGLSAMMPFVAWHIKSQCAAPRRWILYHWGELRTNMAPWVETMLEATFGAPLDIGKFDDIYSHHNRSSDYDDDDATCLEEAVVMRHNEGGMSRAKRMEVYDLMRCKSRMYCNVSSSSSSKQQQQQGFHIGMTLLMRNGPRSFKNASAVISVFEKECRKVQGCRLMVAYPHNLTFCDQVKLMSSTDILVSSHGAQLSNMILMDRDSSVMEFFPKGWLELAGVGQYVHHWLASWSGMVHEGAWRDPEGEHCPFPDKDRRCMSVYKNGKIGHNETYFSEWAKRVLNGVELRKKRGLAALQNSPVSGLCGCN